jgi:hypothetical protein
MVVSFSIPHIHVRIFFFPRSPFSPWQVLGGATFFIDSPEARISSTTGLLIAVTALYIIILGNIPFVGYATTIDKFVLIMLVLLAGIIVVQVVYLLLHNYVYQSEEETTGGVGSDALQSPSAPKYSKPFRYFRDKYFSTSLADTDNSFSTAAAAATGSGASSTATSGAKKSNAHRVSKGKQPAWLLWFSPQSSQLLGEVCVAAMVQEHQKQLIKQKKEAISNICNTKESESDASNTTTNSGSDATKTKIGQDSHHVAASLAVSKRDKQLKKPVATFSLLAIEFGGRVFLIPAILLYTNWLMIDPSPGLLAIALAFDVSL